MQTGEGKTLAAVPAVVWYARSGEGVHVLTANEYLARRDADWMRGIYTWFGLSAGVIQQGMAPAERQAAYRCDVTYATANEAGFDYLRDRIARSPAEQVHRPFSAAVHVIGTNRHESRRIDNQLRGRAGRQGDPGGSQFFVSSEDPLMLKYAANDSRLTHDADAVQRIAEGQNLDIRLFLRKYESVLEGQRLALQERRQNVLTGTTPSDSDTARIVTLTTIDDLWSDYLAAVAELRAGTVWISLGGGNPMGTFLIKLHAMFGELQQTIDEEVTLRLNAPDLSSAAFIDRGATWTYLTTDEPFGSLTERAMRGIVRMIRQTIRGDTD